MSDRSWAGQVARNRVRNEQRKRKVAAERAVIEAAKEWWICGPGAVTPAEVELAAAVEALRALEGE
jgi:hypothetical protein